MLENKTIERLPNRAPLNLLVDTKLRDGLRAYCQKKNSSIRQLFHNLMRPMLNRNCRQQIIIDCERDTTTLNELNLGWPKLKEGMELFSLLVTIYNRNYEKLSELGNANDILRLVQ